MLTIGSTLDQGHQYKGSFCETRVRNLQVITVVDFIVIQEDVNINQARSVVLRRNPPQTRFKRFDSGSKRGRFQIRPGGYHHVEEIGLLKQPPGRRLID